MADITTDLKEHLEVGRAYHFDETDTDFALHERSLAEITRLRSLVETIPERELVHRRVMVEIEATGLLAADWETDGWSASEYNGTARWRWRHGSGWLTISAPGTPMNRDDRFFVEGAWGGSATEACQEVGPAGCGVYGASATEALINAINYQLETTDVSAT